MLLLLLSPIIFLITYIGSKFNNNRRYRNKKTTYKVKLKKTTKKASSGKPKDEIRFNYASGHYALVKDKKIVKENQKKVKKFVVISLSSKENDARKENIAMKKILIQSRKKKQQLLRYRKKNLITQEEYEQICRKGKLNSYFMKRVRSYNEDKFANDNLIETNNWKLHLEDRKKADKLYNQYLENKVASKALEKTKKERANNT